MIYPYIHDRDVVDPQKVNDVLMKMGWKWNSPINLFLNKLNQGQLATLYNQLKSLPKHELDENKSPTIYDENGVIIRSAIKPYLLKTILKLYPSDKIGTRYAPTLNKKSQIVDEYLTSEDFNYKFFDKQFNQKQTPVTKLIPIIVQDFKQWIGDLSEIQVLPGSHSYLQNHNKDFIYGKNIKQAVYNCIKANPNISERQIIEIFAEKFPYTQSKTIGQAIRAVPEIDRRIVVNPKTKRKVNVYFVKNTPTPTPEAPQQEELTAKQKVFASRAIQKKHDLTSYIPKQYVDKPHHIKNIDYFQQLLNQTSLSSKMKTLTQSVINSIKNQGGLASQNQFLILQKLKNGILSE